MKKATIDKKNSDDMKFWTGGKVIIDAIKKNKKKSPKKFIVWRPKELEIIDYIQL